MSAFGGTIHRLGLGRPAARHGGRRARLLLCDSIGCMAAGLRHARVRALAAPLAAWVPGEVREALAETP